MNATILLTDDDRVSRRLVATGLQRIGYDIIEADSGAQALRRCEEHRPDVAIVDINMPGMSGLDLAEYLWEDERIPVIIHSGYDSREYLERATRAGAYAYLIKPVELRQLATTIEVVRAKHQEVDAINAQHISASVFATLALNSKCALGHNIRYVSLPRRAAGGDLLLEANGRDGLQTVLIGDSQGHGLPAAVISALLSKEFYKAVFTGEGLADVVTRLNRGATQFLSRGAFVCAALVQLDPDGGCAVWNGGLPDIVVHTADGRVDTLPSRSFPLGVKDKGREETEGEIRRLRLDGRLYAFTDGAIGACDCRGRDFGEERVRQALVREDDGRALESLLEQILEHSCEGLLSDDVLLAQIGARGLH